jgi:hypothetical protein
MSDDPETARQIAELARDDRPLLVVDVDDVLMEFVRPFTRYLDSHGLELGLSTFRLHGNIADKTTKAAIEDGRTSELIDDFFRAQDQWQEAVADATDTMAALAGNAEIVMLTAMPHRHRAVRRRHLDRMGFPYPLLTTEMPKGPAIRRLRGDTGRPVAFVDDIPHNLVSVRAAVSDAHLFHLMAMPSLRALLPPLPDDMIVVEDWSDAAPRIAAALGI